MSDDLVKRLRNGCIYDEGNTIFPDVNDIDTDALLYEAADMIEELETKLAKAVESLEKLARLGNGDLYDNLAGIMIARITLAKLKGEK